MGILDVVTWLFIQRKPLAKAWNDRKVCRLGVWLCVYARVWVRLPPSYDAHSLIIRSDQDQLGGGPGPGGTKLQQGPHK